MVLSFSFNEQCTGNFFVSSCPKMNKLSDAWYGMSVTLRSVTVQPSLWGTVGLVDQNGESEAGQQGNRKRVGYTLC